MPKLEFKFLFQWSYILLNLIDFSSVQLFPVFINSALEEGNDNPILQLPIDSETQFKSIHLTFSELNLLEDCY